MFLTAILTKRDAVLLNANKCSSLLSYYYILTILWLENLSSIYIKGAFNNYVDKKWRGQKKVHGGSCDKE
jgi:hypothetical protein